MNILRIVAAACLGTVLFPASPARAISVSMADLFFPSYGRARHMDQSNEYLGQTGNLYDGVITGPFIRGAIAAVQFNTTVGTLFGTGDYEYLSLWIDWDRSRTWDTSEEVINIDDRWFDQGTNLLSLDITVPETALIGDTWMRTRFAFDGDLYPAGDLRTGEVEDYLVSVGDMNSVPEPGTLVLLGLGLLPFLAVGRLLKR